MTEAYARLATAVVDGDVAEALRLIHGWLDDGTDPRLIVDEGLMAGMDDVGSRMRSGECFIPEVLLSARTTQACLDVLQPLLVDGHGHGRGKMVIGTVEGDMHDIGKNLVAMLMSGAGFEVVNLGTGVTAGLFVTAVREHEPQIVGMSAMLTTTMPSMERTIVKLEEAGLRDSVKVMVGGAPVTQAWADRVGADAYGENAAAAVEKARALVLSCA
jgi:5-methyltetrahydrofolate--homocysteine methyltransferase